MIPGGPLLIATYLNDWRKLKAIEVTTSSTTSQQHSQLLNLSFYKSWRQSRSNLKTWLTPKICPFRHQALNPDPRLKQLQMRNPATKKLYSHRARRVNKKISIHPALAGPNCFYGCWQTPSLPLVLYVQQGNRIVPTPQSIAEQFISNRDPRSSPTNPSSRQPSSNTPN